MGVVFLLIGLTGIGLFAALERARLTRAEATHVELQEKEEALPPLSPALYVDALAARLAMLVGLALATWGWVSVADPWYHFLRDSIDLSRLVAGLIVLLIPVGLLAALAGWVGYLLGEAYYQPLTEKAPLWAVLIPFRLLSMPLHGIGRRIAPAHASPEDQLLSLSGSPDAFWQMVQDDEGRDLAVVNRQIFDKASELQSIRVRECMTFRTDIVAVEVEDGIEGLRQAFLTSGYSKIPVYREDLDQMLGYCHSSALFRKPKHIEDILADILTVPESMTASQLLVELNQAQKSMAVVIDEYGGTSGVVTMEDVMEEIFGEIEDELDEQTETEIQESEDTWLLSARLEVDYLNDKYDWDLPTGEYESLGGLVVNLHQDLPEQGEVIEAAPFRFEVVGMEETRVTLIRLTFLS